MQPRVRSRGCSLKLAKSSQETSTQQVMNSPLRQVRATHPPELLQLAVLLSRGRQKREVAAALGVPLSTIYRWLEARRRHPFFDAAHTPESGADRLCELIAA